jgi:hypothetical protein
LQIPKSFISIVSDFFWQIELEFATGFIIINHLFDS